jgi:hypothetical protein
MKSNHREMKSNTDYKGHYILIEHEQAHFKDCMYCIKNI